MSLHWTKQMWSTVTLRAERGVTMNQLMVRQAIASNTTSHSTKIPFIDEIGHLMLYSQPDTALYLRVETRCTYIILCAISAYTAGRRQNPLKRVHHITALKWLNIEKLLYAAEKYSHILVFKNRPLVCGCLFCFLMLAMRVRDWQLAGVCMRWPRLHTWY